MFRRVPSLVKRRSAGQTRREVEAAPDATGPAPRGRREEADEPRDGPDPDVSRPVRKGEPAPPHDAPDPDLEREVARLLEAGDVADFVGRVFDRMFGALMELEDMLDALEGDGRVGAEHRRALAAQLDHIQYAYLEEWKAGLLGGLDADEG